MTINAASNSYNPKVAVPWVNQVLCLVESEELRFTLVGVHLRLAVKRQVQ
jgi:hypothetical protein